MSLSSREGSRVLLLRESRQGTSPFRCRGGGQFLCRPSGKGARTGEGHRGQATEEGKGKRCCSPCRGCLRRGCSGCCLCCWTTCPGAEGGGHEWCRPRQPCRTVGSQSRKAYGSYVPATSPAKSPRRVILRQEDSDDEPQLIPADTGPVPKSLGSPRLHPPATEVAVEQLRVETQSEGQQG